MFLQIVIMGKIFFCLCEHFQSELTIYGWVWSKVHVQLQESHNLHLQSALLLLHYMVLVRINSWCLKWANRVNEKSLLIPYLRGWGIYLNTALCHILLKSLCRYIATFLTDLRAVLLWFYKLLFVNFINDGYFSSSAWGWPKVLYMSCFLWE